MADENVKVAAETVDLDTVNDSMIEEKVEINPDANPMEAPPPMTDGNHRVKLTGATDWQQAITKPNARTGESTTYFKTQFRAQVVDEDTNKNKIAFGRENTLTFDGKNVMAYIIKNVLLGMGKTKEEIAQYLGTLDTAKKLATAFRDALAGEPIVKISTKWVARYNAGTKEEPDYKTAMSGMANFPKNADGTYKHVMQMKGIGEVVAQAVIQDYFPDK